MKILAVGHCYSETLPRRKWYALRDLAPECDIRVVTPMRWPEGNLRSDPASSERLMFSPMRTLGAGYGSRYFYTSLEIVKLIRDHQPDIIHIDHEPWSVVAAQLTLLAAMMRPAARIVVFSWWNQPRHIPAPWAAVHRAVLRRTRLLIAGNEGAVNVHRAHGYRGQITVMPQLGVDASTFHPGLPDDRLCTGANLSPRSVVIGFVGRLLAEKGVDVLIEALSMLAGLPWHLLIVGEGPARPDATRLVIQRGLEHRVTFAGAVVQTAVPGWIRCMDVLVLPSSREWCEQFGHVLVEAMACERAVVGSDSGEIPNVIGDAGFVFEAGDCKQLSRQLAALIQDPDARSNYARRGYMRAMSLYTDAAVARRLRDAYRQVVEQN